MAELCRLGSSRSGLWTGVRPARRKTSGSLIAKWSRPSWYPGTCSVTQPHEIAMYAQMFGRLAEIAVYGSRARELISSVMPAG